MREFRVGQRFGKLTVLRQGPPGTQKKKRGWVLQCDCGKVVERRTGLLTSGRCYSCGCSTRVAPKQGGLSKTLAARSWYMMMERCYNPKDVNYANYGGRGIEVCEEWRVSLERFCADMGERPAGLSLDRKDNDGPYCLDNCRWATDAEQRRNTQRTLRVEWEGRQVVLVDLCAELGVAYSVVRGRLKMGWDLEEAIRKPVRPKKKGRPRLAD